MPIYHFNLQDSASCLDRSRCECADLYAARVEAARRVGRLLLDDPERFWSDDECTMEVTDGRGLTLFTLQFMTTDAPSISPRMVIRA